MSTGMFLGTHLPRLDEKGRLILPAKFRERLADGLVMTKGQEHCLFVFPVDEFTKIAEGLAGGPTSDKKVRDFNRIMMSGATDELPDRQGRVTIPPALRAYAGLGRDLAVVGMGNRVEIWDAQAWSRYVEETEPGYAAQAEEVYPGAF
jgi:MraZ protein